MDIKALLKTKVGSAALLIVSIVYFVLPDFIPTHIDDIAFVAYSIYNICNAAKASGLIEQKAISPKETEE